ncbi:MAG: DMT family transporter [Burkholderiaceae bacterium]
MSPDSPRPKPAASAPLPVAVLLFSATLWGLSWWPVKQLVGLGLTGALLPMLAYGTVALFTGWVLWRERAQWRGQAGLLLGLAFVGGWANTAFVSALMVGDVVRVMFLFYLSPVWSVLGGRLFLGERIPPWRAAAVVVAVVGLWLVITGGHAPQSVSLSWADALALTAGLGFAGNNIIARAAQQIPLRSKTVAVFVGCGVLSALAAAWQGAPLTGLPAMAWVGVVIYGGVWLLLATANAAVWCDPHRKRPRGRDLAGRTAGRGADGFVVKGAACRPSSVGRRALSPARGPARNPDPGPRPVPKKEPT